jgi:glycosyltransferase involved in cell wall biosynthesis
MGGASQLGRRQEVAVIIPTVNRAALRDSLAVLITDDGVAEIVVVADRDVDGVRRAVGEMPRDRRVRVVEGPGRGAAWARQWGVERSTAAILLFLDDDVVPGPGLATAHARRHAPRDLVVVGFMPVGNDARRASPAARVYGNDYLAACDEIERDPTRVLSDLWAGNVSLRRESVERVPLADAALDITCREDQVFGLRCARAGLTGVFDRSLLAEHRFERSVPEFLAAARMQAQELELVRRRFPELPEDDAGAALTAGTWARILRVASHRPAGYVMRGAVGVAVRAARLVGAARVEEQGVALLRDLVQQEVFRDQTDRGSIFG